MVGRPAIGEDPGMDPRMERLHPPVEHLRKAGHGGDVGHRQAGVAQGAGGAAGRDELEPGGDQTGGKRGQSRLVRDREERPARRRHRGIGALEIRQHASPVRRDRDGSGEQHRGRPRQEPVFHRADPLVEAGVVVARAGSRRPPGRRSARHRGSRRRDGRCSRSRSRHGRGRHRRRGRRGTPEGATDGC